MMTTFRSKKISAVLLSALITSGLAAGLSAWAGDVANLNRVDFTTNNGSTDIKLVADGPINYKRIKASNNKLVLEISGVDQNHTVNTNFVNADNISHVVIQPMRNERIRLIVRGDELSQPTISVNKVVNTSKFAKKNDTQDITRQIAERTEAALDAMAEENMHPATLAVSDVKQPTEPSDVSTALNGNTLAKANTQSPVVESTLEDTSKEISDTPVDDTELLDDRFFIDDAQTGERVSNKDGEPIALAHLDEQTGLATTDSLARSETFIDTAGRWLNQPSVTDSLAFGLLGLLIIGLVGFIRHKVQRISMNANAAEEHLYDDYQGQQHQRQGGGFRQAARNAMMNQHGAGAGVHSQQKQSASFEQMMAHNARQQQGGSPIGLRSLKGEPQQVPAQRQQPRSPMTSRPAAPSLGKRPASPQATPSSKTVSQRQVASQYARQNNALAAKSPTRKQPSGKPSAKLGASRVGHPSIKPEVNRKRTIGDTALRSEMDRQEQIRREAIQRANLREDITRRPQGAGKAPQAPFRKPATRRATAPNAKLNQGMFANQAGNASDPLPDNPEVLNFLRDVADLMDKEGKPNMVRKVQNNLR